MSRVSQLQACLQTPSLGMNSAQTLTSACAPVGVKSKALLAAVLLSTVVSAPAAHAEKIDGVEDAVRRGDIVYSMIRKGSNIGAHSVTYTILDDGQLQVDTAINIKVKLGFIVAYRYEHLNREVWSADGETLMSLDSQTFRKGEIISVTARRKDGVLYVNDEAGQDYVVDGPVATTSYWNPILLQPGVKMLNTQKGVLSDTNFVQTASDMSMSLPGRTAIDTLEYQSRGELTGITPIYAASSPCWVGLSFIPPKSDVPISYALESYFPSPRPELAGVSVAAPCMALGQLSEKPSQQPPVSAQSQLSEESGALARDESAVSQLAAKRKTQAPLKGTAAASR